MSDDLSNIEVAAWDLHKETLRSLRGKVFIEEQGVPQDIEWDDQDATATHFLVTRHGVAVACGRILDDGKIGRMAVLAEHRGNGLGRQLLQHIIEQAKSRGMQKVYLHAQAHASEFYHKCGFVDAGAPFAEAGIPHQGMELPLTYAGYDSFISAVSYPQPFAQLSLELARSARRRLYIYSPRLDHAVFDDDALATALAALARRSRHTEVRILITDSKQIVKRGHRLLTVSRRLSSSIKIQTLSDHPELTGDTYVIRDTDGICHQPDDAEREGFYQPHSPASARRFIDKFEDLWNKSAPDPQLRVLHL